MTIAREQQDEHDMAQQRMLPYVQRNTFYSIVPTFQKALFDIVLIYIYGTHVHLYIVYYIE